MRRKSVLFPVLLVAALAVLLSGCITAPTMSYQGKLTDPAGNPVANGNYNMTFRLWGPTLTTPKVYWQETQVVAVNDGLFNVSLGTSTPMTPSIFMVPLELGVEVDGDGEMTPRQPLSGAPYAMTLVDGAVVGGTAISVDAEYPGMLNISNIGTGYGLALQSYGRAGVAVDGVDVGNYGFVIDNVNRGGIITNSTGIGLNIYSFGATGSVADDNDAIRARSNEDGIVALDDATDSGRNALYGDSLNGTGIYAITGVSGGNWAGYFAGNINVTGSCTGCAIRYVGRNVSGATLQPGVAVAAAGVEPGAGIANPVMKVLPAAPGQVILGVLVGRAEVTTVKSERDGREMPQLGRVEGPAAPGDYLVIVVQGPTQVQAAPGARIAAGSLVYLGTRGVTTAANGPAIGMALDTVGPDGLVWVLVGFH
jgi:hypothetical protein